MGPTSQRSKRRAALPRVPDGPRSVEERLAFISGYTQAVIDVHHHDLDFARRWLLQMVELEIEAPPSKRRKKR